eukprot:1152402-Pelagomonas_calceolata.AAC.6
MQPAFQEAGGAAYGGPPPPSGPAATYRRRASVHSSRGGGDHAGNDLETGHEHHVDAEAKHAKGTGATLPCSRAWLAFLMVTHNGYGKMTMLRGEEYAQHVPSPSAQLG